MKAVSRPSRTRFTIHPDSAHSFLLQHHSRFAADVNVVLAEAR
jgi:hypothetical protein